MDLLAAVEHIVIHHSASPLDTTVDDIRRWHMEKAWDDIGYHFVIHSDGEVLFGRPVVYKGAHCYGYNGKTIGICVVGDNTLTKHSWLPAQIVSLRSQIHSLRAVYGPIPASGHSDLVGRDKTQCPGLNVRALQL